jgi:hypothetical protein
MRGPWPDWLENNTSRDRDRAATAGAEGPDLLYRFDSLGLGRDASPLLFARRARAKRPSSDLGRDRFGLDLCGAASAPRVGSMRVRASAAALAQVKMRIALLIGNQALSPIPSRPLTAFQVAPKGGKQLLLLDAVLLDLFAGILLVLEPWCRPTAPRPGLARCRVAEFWLQPNLVTLLLVDLFTFWTSENRPNPPPLRSLSKVPPTRPSYLQIVEVILGAVAIACAMRPLRNVPCFD